MLISIVVSVRCFSFLLENVTFFQEVTILPAVLVDILANFNDEFLQPQEENGCFVSTTKY